MGYELRKSMEAFQIMVGRIIVSLVVQNVLAQETRVPHAACDARIQAFEIDPLQASERNTSMAR
jgi:hypothetical protein